MYNFFRKIIEITVDLNDSPYLYNTFIIVLKHLKRFLSQSLQKVLMPQVKKIS